MKGETSVVAKVRPTQTFDVEHSAWCVNHPHDDATHVGTVVAPARVIVRVALCDHCAREWLVGSRS